MSGKVIRLHAVTDSYFGSGILKAGEEFAVMTERIASVAKCDVGTAVAIDGMFIIIVKESYGCIVEEMERGR